MQTKKKSWSIDEACKNHNQALLASDNSFTFSGRDFVPFDKNLKDFLLDGSFDVGSIMMYGSHSGSKDVGDEKFPLSKKDGSIIKSPERPSNGDIRAVNRLYEPKAFS